MTPHPETAADRAAIFASRYNTAFEHPLGDGKDGIILQTNHATAVKFLRLRAAYERELACYRRLAEREVEQVCGHAIPRLIRWDDEMYAIEMEIVSPPYVLDFADAYLDIAPDFPDEVLEQWHGDKSEEFGERWETVLLLLAQLKGQAGIHMLDVKIGNITFDE